ncbi:MAG: IS4 family transposase [Planctomycetaceae bacterium]|nr:IS4 family transposase [Planctomycetaceae bacterium]
MICDTTDINFGSRRQIEQVGPTGNGSGQGFLLHNAMMVDADTKSILGIAGQTICYRPKKKHSKKESRAQRLDRPRESQIWSIVIDEIGPAKNDSQYIYVCDRGADNYEVFCHLVQQKNDWVNRVKEKNRFVLNEQGETVKLQQILNDSPVRGTYELNLRARPNQPARTAKIEVRTGSLSMPLTRQSSAGVKALNLAPIAMNAVWIREPDSPEGVRPLEWMLYTSLAVDTFDQIWEIVEMYETRWLIEEYHKALKSGCQVKSRQLKTGPRLEAMVGLMSVAAVRLLEMKQLALSEPERPARTVVPSLWLNILQAVRKNLHCEEELTIRDFYREVAKLGGFLGRKSDGNPGWLTVWRGWEKLQTLIRGAELAIQLK